MKQREVIPLKQDFDFKLILPGSKSITNRALLCAALAKGKSRLFGALESDDTAIMRNALRKLEVRSSKFKDGIVIEGKGGQFKKGKITLDLHNAGTAVRFLTAIMAVREGETVITGDKRMQERPVGDLIDGLRQLGAKITYLKRKGCPPIKILHFAFRISDSREYVVRMKGDKSSQYFSALLMLGPLLKKPLRIEVVGELVSKPYIDITIAVMKAFGVKVKNNDYQSFVVKPQSYKPVDYYIEGDASAASYWTAMAHLHKGKVRFENLETKKSIQGDSKFLSVLPKLGKGTIDMKDMPDVAMTAAVMAPFVKGETKITGLSTLRIKETDRLAALERELRKIGVRVKTTKDSIIIGSTIGSTIETYNDHRMAMCFAVMGTKIPGIVIENPGCVDKTYPQFWEDLERMYLSKEIKLGQKNLVLTGMRGSGKTYLGKRIAKQLGRKFVDLDVEIEKHENLSVDSGESRTPPEKIPEIVKKHGWDYFRLIEQKMCTKFSNQKSLVIATGGGVVLSPKNMKTLKKNGVNVFLFADPQVLVERIKKSKNRPSLTDKHFADELQSVWLERRDLYLRYADFVWDNTSGKTIISHILYLIS